jgi:hypothetical protein
MLARRAGAVLLAIMLGAGLAACGDDGGSEDDAVDQVDREGDSSDDGNNDDGSSDDGNADDGDGSAIEGALTGERCTELASFFSVMGAAITGAVDEGFADAQRAFEDAVEDVPEEVQDAFTTYVEAYTDYAQALEDAGFDLEDPTSFDISDPAAIAALAEAGQALSDPEFTSAVEDVNAFFAAGCEVG